jgi:hypothetical protein
MALPKLNTPTYELTIPSTNETISYRPYLVKEEKILLLALESQDERQMIRAIKDVIAACTDGAVDTSRIAMFDLEYIFTQLRAKSVGESVQLSVKCDHCEKNNDVEINLENVRLSNSKELNNTIELTDTIGVKMRYPSVDTVLQSRADENASAVDLIFSLLIECVDSIYSGEEIFDATSQSREELNEFLESLNSEQFSRIREFVENIPAAEIDASFKCLQCGEYNEKLLRGLANFFG